MRIITGAAMAVAITFSSSALARELDETEKAEISAYVGDQLRDGESARYRWPEMVSTAGYCGWVNSKNAYGAYTGFQPFFVNGLKSSQTGHWVIVSVDIADGDAGSDDTIIVHTMCARQGYDLSEMPPG